MGRNIQPSEYGFQQVFPQTFNANSGATGINAYDATLGSGYASRVIEQGHDIIVSLPFGATGNNITGCVALGAYVPGDLNNGSFYPNNGLVFINDESRAIINNLIKTNNTTGELNYTTFAFDRGVAIRSYNTNLYQGIASGLITDGSTASIGNFSSPRALKVTGVLVTSSSDATTFTQGYAVDYFDLHSGYGLLTTYRNSNQSASGRFVRLNLINYSSTGFTVVSGITLTDTINSGATSGCFCTPSVVKDLSYTGANVSRVLIGYQSDTGVTSGQLCAQLVEISGSTVTTGDPVVIRSVTPSGSQNYVNFISVTHHLKGSVNAFVISTAVREAVGGFIQNSGQLIAATPSSGLVLSGTFGAAVPIFNSTGGTSGCTLPVCTALNTFTGTNAYGVVVALTGTSSTTGVAYRQMYEVSGNTISTGVVATGVFSVIDISGVTGFFAGSSGVFTSMGGNSYTAMNSGFYVNTRISEISSTVTSSGLISHIGYGAIGTGNQYSGSCFLNFIHVPYSLSSTGFTQYATLTHADAAGALNSGSLNVNRNVGINFPGPLPFYIVSGNPYGGVHGSFVEIPVPGTGITSSEPFALGQSGLSLVTYKTTTGFFPSGTAAAASGYFGGCFFQGATISGANQLGSKTTFPCRIRSAYALTSGVSTAQTKLIKSGANPPEFVSGTALILKLFGNYPDITGFTMFQGPLNNPQLHQITMPSPTGEQTYTRIIDAFKSPALRSSNPLVAGSASGWFSYNYPPESIGVVITNDTGNVFTVSSNNYFTTGQVTVKFAKTEAAKRQLIKDALGQYTIKDNKNVFG